MSHMCVCVCVYSLTGLCILTSGVYSSETHIDLIF